MSLAQNLKLARIKKGYKQEELAKLVGKSKNVISNWERGDNKPDADTLFDLCDILGVDANYLLGWENNQNLSLSIKEQEHIKKFRSLDSYGKKQVNAVLNNEYTRVQEQSMQIEEESTPYTYAKTEYLTGLSAGTGLFVFDDIPTQIVDVPEEFKSADFVIGVSGDSMEPTFRDGDRVAVIKQKVLHPGDIEVFMIDGNGYIKELGNNVLISHNSKYGPIPFAESICCIGKVIGKI